MRRLPLLLALVIAACSGGAPSGPSAAVPDAPAPGARPAGALDHVSTSANSPPEVVMRTTPRAVNGVVSGFLPLDVKINLCKSSDPDEGDSLKSNVDWGDGVQTGQGHPGAGTDPQEGGPATGCGGTGCCRHRHRFDREGSFTVAASVSDKHIHDQSGDVAGLARTTVRFTVNAGSAPVALTCSFSTFIDFESVPAETELPVTIDGVVFASDSGAVVPLPGITNMSGNLLIGEPGVTITPPGPPNGYSFPFGIVSGESLQVQGFLNGSLVFTDTFAGSTTVILEVEDDESEEEVAIDLGQATAGVRTSTNWFSYQGTELPSTTSA